LWGKQLGPALARVAILAAGLGIHVAVVAPVIMLAAAAKNRVVKAAVCVVVLYVLFGLVYGAVSLCYYNGRNWVLYAACRCRRCTSPSASLRIFCSGLSTCRPT
jgi:hypothetical protein